MKARLRKSRLSVTLKYVFVEDKSSWKCIFPITDVFFGYTMERNSSASWGVYSRELQDAQGLCHPSELGSAEPRPGRQASWLRMTGSRVK